MTYPNPSTGSFSIDLNEEIPFDIVLAPLEGGKKYEKINHLGKGIIDTSTLKPGEYSLIILHEGQVVNQQHVLIK